MKETKLSHCRMVLLALASVALLTPVVRGATITPQLNDLILGFRATANPGQTLNLEVDLGPMSQFYTATPGQVIPLPGLSVLDLSATFGASWVTRTDLYWGAVATTGRAAGTPDSHAPVGTLWATAPNCATAFNRGSVFAQKNASATIEAMIAPGAAGSLYGATSTANSTVAAVITSTLAGSWTAQDLKTAGTSFGYFNPTVDNYMGTNIVVSQLYELQPGTGPGTYLGDLILTDQGLTFRRATATAAICKQNVVLQTGTNCTATATVDDIDGGSTGYCLSLSLDSAGPFPIGHTNVTLMVTDGVGNQDQCTTTVTVEGGAPSISCPANIAQCSPVVTYTTPSATGCNTPITVACVPPSGSTFPAGITTVTCTATDAAHKTGTCSFTVNINGAAPTVTCPGPIVANVPSGQTNMVITYTTPSGSGCATPITVACVPASGSTFPVGTTTVTCTATDAANKTGTCSFSVTVNGAGVNGIIAQVNALTDSKLTKARKNSLLNSLNLAQADLNHQPKPRTLQACGQLKGFLIKVKLYGQLGIITQAEAASLTASATAEKVAIGCK